MTIGESLARLVVSWSEPEAAQWFDVDQLIPYVAGRCRLNRGALVEADVLVRHWLSKCERGGSTFVVALAVLHEARLLAEEQEPEDARLVTEALEGAT